MNCAQIQAGRKIRKCEMCWFIFWDFTKAERCGKIKMYVKASDISIERIDLMEQQNENRQHEPSGAARPRTRRKTRRRVRYDRIAIALILLIAILVLMGSCTCSCVKCVCSPSESSETESSGTDKDEQTTDAEGGEDSSGAASQTTAAQNAVSLSLTAEDMGKGPLAVVNAETEYKFPAGDVELVNVFDKRNGSYTVSSMDVQLDAEAVEQLNVLLSEFSTIYGKTDIQVESGYRSKQDQQERYSNGSSIFPGGFSDYHTGRSFDLNISGESGNSYYTPTGDYAWIAEHAHEYGFVVRYPDGKIDSTGVNPRAYTFHYAGVPHSAYMYEYDYSLEEYVEAIRAYSVTEPLSFKVGDITWKIFYTEGAAAGGTVVSIPSCEEYTVSGDNLGGFIVAYH